MFLSLVAILVAVRGKRRRAAAYTD
jgi:hypothetical protein